LTLNPDEAPQLQLRGFIFVFAPICYDVPMAKDKLTEKQFMLIINGPSCGGKSSVSDIITGEYGGVFNSRNDTLKWLISDYEPSMHKVVVQDITLAATRAAISANLSVIKEGAFWSEPEDYVKLAEDTGLPLFVANVEAPWDVLASRFEARIQAKKQGVKKIANVDPAKFKAIYDMYRETKADTELNFDSSLQTPEEIANVIVDYIKSRI
jgi:predicted kinase